MMPSMSEQISLARDGFVVTVTLEKPTMPAAFFAECEDLFRGLAADRELRAVVIRAAGKAFSYGLDLRAAFSDLGPHLGGGGTAGPRSELLALIRKLQRSFTEVAACPVPVIAAIHGWCIGGGLDLAAACDLRVCSRDALFSLRETKIAIVADLGSLQRLPPIIGKGATRELAFTGKDVNADRALQLGLVNAVYENAEATYAGAMAMAHEIAANPPLTVRGVKEVLDHGEGKSVAEGLDYVATWNSAFLASEDLGEAMAAFAAKRPPSYKGK